MNTPTKHNFQTIELTARDLPLHCPMPTVKLWDSHPRVFIDVTTTGEAMCPYCGTHYKLTGPTKASH